MVSSLLKSKSLSWENRSFTIHCRSGRRKATLYHTTGYLKCSKRFWAHVVTSQFADTEKRHRILQIAI